MRRAKGTRSDARDLVPQASLCISEASALSQVKLVEGEDDAEVGGALFPAQLLDADGQQVDMRPRNTWSARAHEVRHPIITACLDGLHPWYHWVFPC